MAESPVSQPQGYGDTSIAAPSVIEASSTAQSVAATSSTTPLDDTPAASTSSTSLGPFTFSSSSTVDNGSPAASTADASTPSTQSSSPTGTASTGTSSDFDYTQIFNTAVRGYTAAEINDAPFSTLCPGGDCFKACQDFSLMLNSGFYEYNPSAELPTSFSTTDITLFGLCTNIANITSAVAHTKDLPNAAKYFDPQANSQYDVNKVVSGTAQCLFGTCEATRKPLECEPLCSTFVTQESISTFNFVNTYKCITKLCDNTCGLPYANQDVFGIGVLASCAIQALILLLYAIFCVVRMPHNNSYIAISTSSKATPSPKRTMDAVADRVNAAASGFLVAQCFFAITAAIASFRLAPWSIDPINGYALLFIASIGFIPPVLTLMLLRSQKRREWYHIFMVLLSWILSTSLFFILLGNLQDVRNDSERVAQARNALYSVDACGGYSAMSLCQETGKIDPINYMMGFFNYDSIPNIDNIWLIWLFPFLILIMLSLHRFFPHLAAKTLSGMTKNRFSNRYTSTMDTVRRPLLVLAISMFLLCFFYQIFLVKKYIEMDLIDTRRKTGWTFGQIVAVLLWAPFLFELTIGWFLEWMKEKREDKKHNQSLGHSTQPSMSQGQAGPTTHHAAGSSSGQTPLLNGGTPTMQSTPYMGAHPPPLSPTGPPPATPTMTSYVPPSRQSTMQHHPQSPTSPTTPTNVTTHPLHTVQSNHSTRPGRQSPTPSTTSISNYSVASTVSQSRGGQRPISQVWMVGR